MIHVLFMGKFSGCPSLEALLCYQFRERTSFTNDYEQEAKQSDMTATRFLNQSPAEYIIPKHNNLSMIHAHIPLVQ